ncbi:sigma factor [Streptomyces incanus]|uniref:Sigma factor n=1 Tax=Streptomyces incanus TaxID=887453 RepID=A0ABW0XE24_9ACTN
MGKDGREGGYGDFAVARAGHLYRSACLLTAGDTHLAEDLVQETLGRVYVHWGRVSRVDNPAGYAQTVLTRAFLTHRRRRSSTERSTAVFPDLPEEYAYLVVDDGEGKSFVQLNVQHRSLDDADRLYGSAEMLDDGTRVATQQGPGEKGAVGVVMWTVDTLRADGMRVVISAFNTGAQHEDATRDAPALSMKELRKITLSSRWDDLAWPDR